MGCAKAGDSARLARALAHLHKQTPAVIHRDLKPENVLVDSGYNPKLGDFGAARESTATSTMRGTPVRGARAATDREDDREDRPVGFRGVLEVMWTHAPKLYADREMDLGDLLNGVASGTVFPRVPRTSFLADLVCACSATRPRDRPPFNMVIEILSSGDISVAGASLPPGPGPRPDDDDLKIRSPMSYENCSTTYATRQEEEVAVHRRLSDKACQTGEEEAAGGGRRSLYLGAECTLLTGHLLPLCCPGCFKNRRTSVAPSERLTEAIESGGTAACGEEHHHHHHHHHKKKKHRKPPGMLGGIERVSSRAPAPNDGRVSSSRESESQG